VGGSHVGVFNGLRKNGDDLSTCCWQNIVGCVWGRRWQPLYVMDHPEETRAVANRDLQGIASLLNNQWCILSL
jgi:hypothetical protein